MRAVVLAAVVVVLVAACRGEVPPPDRPYNILMLLPVSSKSHRNVFLPVAEALADRGHKITMLVNHPPATKHPNIKEINHGMPDFREDNMNMFEARKSPAGGLQMFQKALPAMASKMYKIPEVKELYERRKEFDLIVINHMFNEIAYPFAHEMVFITIATPGLDARQSAVMGNVISPAYMPNMLKDFPKPYSTWHRLLNFLGHMFVPWYWRNWAIVPYVQKEISAQFPDLPPLLDIERNQSLTLMNTHFSMETAVPLLPSQIEVGAMHCRPGKPLPENLQEWIDGAEDGVVYFSLGSVTRGSSMPDEYRDMFIEAFGKMKQRIIWKFEGDLEVPENVMMSKWLPQQDILAQANVRVFITHGGLLSTQESFYHATPVLAVPIFGDQPKNGRNIESNGLGKMLVWEDLSADLIKDTLEEIINNPMYKQRAEGVAAPLRDQLTTPKDRAVFWTEYVIRHRGAPRLRTPAADLSWREYLMLDVLLIVHVAAYLTYRLGRCLAALLLRKMCGGAKKKTD